MKIKFLDLSRYLLSPCMKICAICNVFFFSYFSQCSLFFLFCKRVDNGSSDPKRETDENRSPEEETRKWGSLYGTWFEDGQARRRSSQTAQLPLGTCSAAATWTILSHFPLSSGYLKSASLLNRLEEKREWCAPCLGTNEWAVVIHNFSAEETRLTGNFIITSLSNQES